MLHYPSRHSLFHYPSHWIPSVFAIIAVICISLLLNPAGGIAPIFRIIDVIGIAILLYSASWVKIIRKK